MKSRLRLRNNTKGIECQNCKQPLSSQDNFCSNCGQVNDLKPLSVKKYITELFAGFFAFDTRTFKTLGQLLFKPGKVTAAYIKGERMKYVNPFQLYLHTSIVFFLFIGFFSSYDEYQKIIHVDDNTELTEQQRDSILNEVKVGTISFEFSEKPIDSLTNEDIKTYINRKLDSLFNSKKVHEILVDKTLDSIDIGDEMQYIAIQSLPELLRGLKKRYYFETDSEDRLKEFKKLYISEFNTHLETNGITYQVDEKVVKQTDGGYLVEKAFGSRFFEKTHSFSKCKTKDIGRALDSLGYERSHFNVYLFKKSKQVSNLSDDKDYQKDFVKNLISKSSVVVFFMLPLFVLFVMLFYIKKKMNYTEHLVFIFNNQTVFFILLFIAIVLDRIFESDIIVAFMFLIFAVYLYKAILTYYQESWFLSLLKMSLLGAIYFVFLSVGAIATSLAAFLF